MSNPENQIQGQNLNGKIPSPTDASPTLEPPVEGQTIVTRPGGEGGKFVCDICGKSLNSKVELEMHMESQHNVYQKTPKRKLAAKKSTRAKKKR